MTIRVAINGYGTIGKRVADAVAAQSDMEVVGVTKTRPSFGCDLAVRKGYPLFCTFDDADRIAAFAASGYDCSGGISDLLSLCDVVVDCSPGGRVKNMGGWCNRPSSSCKAIWQSKRHFLTKVRELAAHKMQKHIRSFV